MLVLTRKRGESIRIGDDIVITLSGINGSRAGIAIDAPRDIPIIRSELEGGGHDRKGKDGADGDSGAT